MNIVINEAYFFETFQRLINEYQLDIRVVEISLKQYRRKTNVSKSHSEAAATSLSQSSNEQSGYGFIYVPTLDDEAMLIELMKTQKKIDTVSYICQRSNRTVDRVQRNNNSNHNKPSSVGKTARELNSSSFSSMSSKNSSGNITHFSNGNYSQDPTNLTSNTHSPGNMLYFYPSPPSVTSLPAAPSMSNSFFYVNNGYFPPPFNTMQPSPNFPHVQTTAAVSSSIVDFHNSSNNNHHQSSTEINSNNSYFHYPTPFYSPTNVYQQYPISSLHQNQSFGDSVPNIPHFMSSDQHQSHQPSSTLDIDHQHPDRLHSTPKISEPFNQQNQSPQPAQLLFLTQSDVYMYNVNNNLQNQNQNQIHPTLPTLSHDENMQHISNNQIHQPFYFIPNQTAYPESNIYYVPNHMRTTQQNSNNSSNNQATDRTNHAKKVARANQSMNDSTFNSSSNQSYHKTKK